MKHALALLALSALVGCGSMHTYRYPLAAPAAPSRARPAVYFEGNLPQAAMQELSIVESVGTGTRSSMEEVVAAMQDEAARWGASAVVRVKVECGYGQCHGWGVAVRFVDR